MNHLRRLAIVGSFAVILLPALPAWAGGPVMKCGSGVPVLWPDAGAHIPYNPDRGPLRPLDDAGASAALQRAVVTWAAVPTATVRYVNAGQLPVDVDITNFTQFLFEPEPDGISPVVFDDTGEIFDLVFGPGSGVLGIAGAVFVDVDGLPCTRGTIVEAAAAFNGPEFDGEPSVVQDVMVHEFGHYTGLAHSVVNGQNLLLGDPTGPAPFTFGDAPLDTLETMYPFNFGPGSDTQTLARDDIAAVSTLYPNPAFFTGTGSISGKIISPNGTTPLTGINVVARNLANPLKDAVSAISGDFAFDDSSTDPRAGTYRLNGLTPNAQYAVYIDGILAGGFSTTPRKIPGPEEFYNGARESFDPVRDNPQVFTPIRAVAGVPAIGVNIIVNRLAPGPIPLGTGDAFEIFPPFKVRFCGIDYDSFFVNSNGTVSFGEGQPFFGTDRTEFLLRQAPLIAGALTNSGLDPEAGGTVSFAQSATDVTVRFDNVSELGPTNGPNTFSIRMFRSPAPAWEARYGALGARHGFGGFSCGGRVTSGFEKSSTLSPLVVAVDKTAVWERFSFDRNTLANHTFLFVGPGRFRDTFEGDGSRRNDTFETATPIALPFQSALGFSTIEPLGGDVDYYRFEGRAGDIVAIETVPGNPSIFTTVGLFRRGPHGEPVLVEDADLPDVFPASARVVRLPADGTYAVAISTFGDTGFTGAGTDFGRYNLSVVKYRGEVLHVGEFGSVQVPLGFSFPFQGQAWSSVFVNGPGTLTFGAADGNPNFSVPLFLGGPPRISPLWQDYDPSFGVVLAEHGPDRLTVHYISVWGVITDRPNYFSTELRKDGRIRVTYGATDAERGSGLAGVTPGGGAPDPGPSDLSRRGTWPAAGTTYEQLLFNGPELDLFFRTLTFVPFGWQTPE